MPQPDMFTAKYVSGCVLSSRRDQIEILSTCIANTQPSKNMVHKQRYLNIHSFTRALLEWFSLTSLFLQKFWFHVFTATIRDVNLNNQIINIFLLYMYTKSVVSF